MPGYPPRKRIPLATDKQVAKKLLADLIANAERGIASMPDLASSGQSLEPLIVEFGEGIGRKTTTHYTSTVLRDVRRVVSRCRLDTIADLRAKGLPVRVEKFVGRCSKGMTH